MTGQVAINEIFGPTVQGEGPMMGRRAVFVRTARCDLSCAWCDTPYTWDWVNHDPGKEIHNMTLDDVVIQVNMADPAHTCGVVVTGGEPLLQRTTIAVLANRLLAGRPWVQIETNGRHAPPEGLDPKVMIVASPKLANSGMPHEKRVVRDRLARLQEWPATFKFVVTSADDLTEVDQLVADHGLTDVWVMPEGTTAGKVAAIDALADQIIERGYNLSTRMHVTLWGSRRAV